MCILFNLLLCIGLVVDYFLYDVLVVVVYCYDLLCSVCIMLWMVDFIFCVGLLCFIDVFWLVVLILLLVVGVDCLVDVVGSCEFVVVVWVIC